MARASSQEPEEWVDGFLFVANRPALDFLNTKPVLAEGPTELLPDFDALERWLIASGIVNSAKTKSLLRSWRQSAEANDFLKELIGFRERLRKAVVRMEAGATPSDDFLREVNTRLLEYPPRTALRKREGRIVMEPIFEPRGAGGFMGADCPGRGRFAERDADAAASSVRVVCPSLFRYEQEGIAAVVQYESLRQQGEGCELSAEEARGGFGLKRRHTPGAKAPFVLTL